MAIKRVLIIDDEPAARANLRKVLEGFEQLKVIAEISDGQTAIAEILSKKPDIVFLDIEMPEINGFDVAKATSHINCQLVFVTAYDQYALDAFNTNAIDYLLKPVRPSLIEKCIKKILHQEELVIERIEHHSQQKEQILVSDGTVTRVLEGDHITFVESIGRYRRIHLSLTGQTTHNLETIITDTTLDDFSKQLPTSLFLRIHRGFIINTQYLVNFYMKSRRHYVLLKAVESPIPVARTQLKALKSFFENIKL